MMNNLPLCISLLTIFCLKLLADEPYSKYIKVYEIKSFDIPTLELPVGSNLYLFSALVEQNIASPNDVNKFLECFIQKFGISELYINFHPHQSETTREIIHKKLTSLCKNLIVIPDNIMIEKLLMSNRLINIYGIGTSLLIYGTYFSKENNVYALSNYFSKVIG